MDKSRQQFEEVAEKEGLPLELFNGDYNWLKTRLAWKFWQASRESLEVGLPKPRRVEYQNYVDHEAIGFNLAVGICQDILKNIGVKVHE